MKKILIMGIAIVVGAIVNAASVSWSAEMIFASDGSGAEGVDYAVYFLADSDYAYTSAVTDVGNKDFAFLSNAKEGDAGFYALSESDGYAENTAYGYAAPLSTSTYLVIFDAAKVEDATHVYITSVTENRSLEINILEGSDPMAFGDILGTKNADNWIAITSNSGGGDVPEPTSGLLLMLGVAGLALRRKVK